MYVTLAGGALIPLFLALTFGLPPRYLLYVTLFFVPFSATAVLNVPDVPFGLQPYHIGVLGLGLKIVARLILGTPLLLPSRSLAPIAVLVMFWLWALFVCAFHGAPSVAVAQQAHLSVGLMLLLACILIPQTPADRQTAVMAYLVGCGFAAIWGLLQFGLFFVGLSYPSFIFNSSVGDSAGGFESVLAAGDVLRVSSVSTEPSTLARELIAAITLCLPILTLAWNDFSATSQRVAIAVVALASLCLLLSTSTTGYIGIALIFVTLMIILPKARSRFVLLFLAGASLIACAAFVIPGLREAIMQSTVEKSTEGSLIQRLVSIAAAWDSFREAPFTGHGLGTVTSDDLVVKLLSNLGLPGLTLFVLLCWYVFSRSLSYVALARQLELPLTPSTHALLLGSIAAFATRIAMDSFSGITYQYGSFWALMGFVLMTLRASRPSVAFSSAR